MSQHFQSYFSHALLKKSSLIFTQTLPTLGMLCLIEFEFVSSNYLDLAFASSAAFLFVTVLPGS